MKAAVIAGSQQLQIVDANVPEPGPREVRVRLEGCGVCASNVPVWEGRPWFRYPLGAGEPGHEGWGVVDAVGDAAGDVDVGARVAFLSNRAYAEVDVASADALVAIPPSLTLFPGEAFGCAMNIFARSDVHAGQTVAIVGAGFLGNALVQLCKAAGAHVIAISRRASAREIALACGADEALPMDGAASAERVIECTGKQEALDLATNIVRERGRLVIAGYHQDGLRQVDMQKWNWLGIDVINAHERDARQYVRGMEAAVDAITDGRLNPDLLLTNTYALDELGHALDDVRERPDGFVKGMVVFG
jgi:threonine dehydrogenase-like Zn-dependent dehydrogenase